MVKKLCFFAVIASLFFSQSAAIAAGELWRIAGDDNAIKVFISDPINESGQGQIIPDSFKKALETALANRKSIKFELVKTQAECEVQVSSIIKKFMYMEKGPMKPTPGIGTTLLDAAASMTQNYAEMTVSFIVTNPKTGGLLWSDTLNPYVKKKMAPEESISLICAKVASDFAWKCFGKPS
jgi:hypothetical protein